MVSSLKSILPIRSFAVATVVLSLGGCAAAPDSSDPEAVAEYAEVNDPAEPTMRAIFAFNRTLDIVVLKPAASIYKDVVPDKGRAAVHNFLNNLRSPVIFFNNVLQGDLKQALETLMRFLVNTTVGIAGINDTAAELGMEYRNEDFGQTLAVWNMPEGPYIMLPILGPSNPRDAVGRVVDFIIDPLNMWAGNTDNGWAVPTRTAVDAVDFRALHFDTIADLEKSSLDFYATVRTLYRQRRIDEINNGRVDPAISVPSIGERLNDGPALEEISQAD